MGLPNEYMYLTLAQNLADQFWLRLYRMEGMGSMFLTVITIQEEKKKKSGPTEESLGVINKKPFIFFSCLVRSE